MDGLDVLQRMRAVHADLPVIILTGHGDADDAMVGIKLEITDFIQKPVDIEALTSRIRRAVSARKTGPLREKTVGELMVPIESYEKVYADQPVREALIALKKTFFTRWWARSRRSATGRCWSSSGTARWSE